MQNFPLNKFFSLKNDQIIIRNRKAMKKIASLPLFFPCQPSIFASHSFPPLHKFFDINSATAAVFRVPSPKKTVHSSFPPAKSTFFRILFPNVDSRYLKPKNIQLGVKKVSVCFPSTQLFKHYFSGDA